MTLIELARRYHTAPSTCYRWVQKGLPDLGGRRVFLEAIRRGKKFLTSSAAVARFFARLEYAHPTPPPSNIRAPTKRERDSARARKELQDQYGI
jgi:Protein of unknown function (DUF1580)